MQIYSKYAKYANFSCIFDYQTLFWYFYKMGMNNCPSPRHYSHEPSRKIYEVRHLSLKQPWLKFFQALLNTWVLSVYPFLCIYADTEVVVCYGPAILEAVENGFQTVV